MGRVALNPFSVLGIKPKLSKHSTTDWHSHLKSFNFKLGMRWPRPESQLCLAGSLLFLISHL